jgi:beta-galactosidase
MENIIFVQIENEYGSYGNDKDYLEYFKNLYLSNGVSCPLITSDGDIKMLLDSGTLPDVLASVNYRWDSVSALKVLEKYHGNQPGIPLYEKRNGELFLIFFLREENRCKNDWKS